MDRDEGFRRLQALLDEAREIVGFLVQPPAQSTANPSGFSIGVGLGSPGINIEVGAVEPAGFAIGVSLGVPIAEGQFVQSVSGFGVTVGLGIPNVDASLPPDINVSPAGFGMAVSLGTPTAAVGTQFTETWGENSTDTHTAVTTDTRLNDPATTTNFGTSESFFTEWDFGAGSAQNVALLRFDISSLPADAVITSAQISLVTKNAVTEDVTVHAYEALRTDWERLEANYVSYKTGSNWSSPGARGASTDVTGNPAANSGAKTSWTLANGSVSGTTMTSSNFASYVQSRITAGADTIDLVLQNAFEIGQHINFHSSRGANGSRPKLTMTYTSVTGGSGSSGGPGVTGAYVIHSDGLLYDPAGIFVSNPRGGSIFPSQPGADAALYKTYLGNPGWRPKVMRLSCLLATGTPQTPTASNTTIDNCLDTYAGDLNGASGMGIAVIVDWHRIGGFPQDQAGTGTGSMLDSMAVFYRRIAQKYRNNPRVWFQTYNEIGDFGDVSQTATGGWQFAASDVSKWRTAANTLISAIRTAGTGTVGTSTATVNRAPIVVPCMLTGADIINGTTFNYNIGFAMPVSQRSSILAHGQAIIDAAPSLPGLNTKNIFWDVHLYGNYNTATRINYLDEFLAEIKNRGQLVMFGEYAESIPPGNRFQSTRNMHKLRSEYGTTGTAGTATGKYFIDLVWDYDGGDPNDMCATGPSSRDGIQNTNNLTNPTNLTRLGSVAWDGTHPGTFAPGDLSTATGGNGT